VKGTHETGNKGSFSKMKKTRPTLENVVLLVLYHSEGRKIPSRTVFHKTIYLLDKIIGLKQFTGRDLGFRSYYYGPFSRTLADAVAELKGLGFVDEKVVERDPFIYGNTRESTRIELIMCDGVEEVAEDLIRTFPELDKKIKYVIGKLKKLGSDQSYRTLSLAAKIYYILEREGRKMNDAEIKKPQRSSAGNSLMMI
jgi:hypothetical protein